MKITPCLWFDNEAEEASDFYVSIFPNSKIKTIVPYTIETPSNKPIGSTMTVSFELAGHEFLALNGGPYFKANPSISFMVMCKTKDEVDHLWNKLSKGNSKELMSLDKYPFSERYGWIQDKFGISWQLICADTKEKSKIIPSLLFTNEKSGKAEEAVKFYLSTFKNSKLGTLILYEKDQEPNKKGNLMFSDFKLEDTWLSAMDGGNVHNFTFNEGISLMIECIDQKEINYFYEKLSAVPEAEVCGWLKDKFGISWQLITPDMEELSKNKQVMEVMLDMKRIDIEKLRKFSNTKRITVEVKVHAPIEKVWLSWTKPEHITKWNFASDDWECPSAQNNVKTGGKFKIRMSAKDGSSAFDFEGVYDDIIKHKKISYSMSDGRRVTTLFEPHGEKTNIKTTFDAEHENPIEMQKAGWQAILNNFKKYIEKN